MSTFFVRTIAPDIGITGSWQEIDANTATEAVKAVCGYPVAEGTSRGPRKGICAEARAGSKAGLGKFFYRRAQH